LAWNEFDNDIERIARNLLRSFAELPERSVAGGK